jgi:hypothetical protein
LEQVVNNAVVYGQTNIILSIVQNGDNILTLNLQGTPQAEYYVMESPDVTAAMSAWTPLEGSTNTAPSPSGQWSFIVTNDAPQQFYRLKALHPAP